jgi:hypothetical protein
MANSGPEQGHRQAATDLAEQCAPYTAIGRAETRTTLAVRNRAISPRNLARRQASKPPTRDRRARGRRVSEFVEQSRWRGLVDTFRSRPLQLQRVRPTFYVSENRIASIPLDGRACHSAAERPGRAGRRNGVGSENPESAFA